MRAPLAHRMARRPDARPARAAAAAAAAPPTVRFAKYQGLGNDFIMVSGMCVSVVWSQIGRGLTLTFPPFPTHR